VPEWLASKINWGGAQAKPAAAPAPTRQPAPAQQPQRRAPEPVAAGDDFNDDIPF
jgi:hypothetical protein